MYKLIITLLSVATAGPISAQGPGQGRGGMPADFQDKIHALFAHPEQIHRTVDLTEN